MELLHDAPLTRNPLLARAQAFHLQNAQTADNRTAAELTGALSLVWVVLCAQPTPEEQLLGNVERLWDQAGDLRGREIAEHQSGDTFKSTGNM